ncbi:circumsporozoite protein [Diachasma alloeum]|uniref:circumsporozoite protein n=1 Tax=Diachasma alloeum TaxID=454923 RepID=UPI0007382DFB|nr:circumsporozoite protein [Diachasma alloeum]
MKSFKMFRTLKKFCSLQSLRNLQFHTSPLTPQTWSHFQFLKTTRNSSLKAPEKIQKPSDLWKISGVAPVNSLPLGPSLPPNLTPPKVSRNPRSHVFYSTCSDKPPKKPDCPPKPKKCPEESPCSEKSYENFCPNSKDQSSCSTNKPQCPDKCPEPPKPKPKPCPPPEDRSVCVKPKPKPKPCSQPEDRSMCSKPPAKPSGCGGGKKPPPCSRSYSSCAAEATDKTRDITFGERQRQKIAEFCSRRKLNGKKENEIVGKNCEEVCEKDESTGDRVKREREEMTECLKEKTKFSELGYTRVHCKECIRDIMSRDAKRFLRELDPYGGVLHLKVGKVSSNHEERAQKRKNNWIESILTQ